jgi:DNA processing protein
VPPLTAAQSLMILNGLPHLGPVTLHRLLAALGGDPGRVLTATREELLQVQGVGPVIADTLRGWAAHFDLPAEEERVRRSGTEFVVGMDPTYPRLLREVHDPPIGLYRRGSTPAGQRCLAIVGSRRTTQYGLNVAHTFAGELSRAGFCIVSGLARGIDTAAHEGALAAGGTTVAVLGCGIDRVYPPENLGLQRRIEAAGAVLSEFPFGRPTDRQSFAMRNRIVSGMSEAVIVVESGVSGGAMIAARFAGEQGRLLFAVPGRVDQPTSAGCHQLIRDGATLLTTVDELLSELSYLEGMHPRTASIPKPPGTTVPPGLDSEARALLERLREGAMLGPDGLAAAADLPVAQVCAALLRLELARLVVRHPDGTFEAAVPS